MVVRKKSRRDFLSLLGVGTGSSLLHSPLLALIDGVIASELSRAQAQASDPAPRKWLDFVMPGGPSRWVFDLMLRPYAGGGSFVSNPQVGTRFVASGGRYTDIQYATVAIKGMNVPYIWQFPVPAVGGGERPMSDLLDNFLNLRGINTGNAGHPGSQALHFLPLGVTQGLPALSGDRSSAPIAGVCNTIAEFRYKSVAGRSAVQVSGTNLINSLMDPFQSQGSAAFKTTQALIRGYILDSKNALFAEAEGRHPKADVISNAVRGADEIILGSYGNLAQVWTSLLTKYRDLITRAISQQNVIVGLNDLPIGSTGTRDDTYSITIGDGVVVGNADLRSMITATTTVGDMAESFAIAEFILMNGLSDSTTLRLAPLSGLNINGAVGVDAFDEHFTGKMICTFINSFYARAQAACLLELIDRLKAAGIFDETLINVCGEFNRSPREDGTGSDHGIQAASLALYSGAVNGPVVIGNIAGDSPDRLRGGTWGYGAATGGQMLDPGHMIATVARMLRVPSPTAAKASLVAINGAGEFVPAPGVGLGTIV